MRTTRSFGYNANGEVCDLNRLTWAQLLEAENRSGGDLDVRLVYTGMTARLNGSNASGLFAEEDEHAEEMRLDGSGFSSQSAIPGVLVAPELDRTDRRQVGISIPVPAGFFVGVDGGRHSDVSTAMGIMAADGSESS